MIEMQNLKNHIIRFGIPGSNSLSSFKTDALRRIDEPDTKVVIVDMYGEFQKILNAHTDIANVVVGDNLGKFNHAAKLNILIPNSEKARDITLNLLGMLSGYDIFITDGWTVMPYKDEETASRFLELLAATDNRVHIHTENVEDMISTSAGQKIVTSVGMVYIHKLYASDRDRLKELFGDRLHCRLQAWDIADYYKVNNIKEECLMAQIDEKENKYRELL